METLVRRLGRILSLKKSDEPPIPLHRASRMGRLERTLSVWMDEKGWRIPVRTFSEAAQRLGTDTGTLYAYFQERMGMDFRTWRTRLRLEDAKQMLAENPLLSPAEAARLCGFSNRSNFSRQFLAYTGKTPAEWQKHIISGEGGV